MRRKTAKAIREIKAVQAWLREEEEAKKKADKGIRYVKMCIECPFFDGGPHSEPAECVHPDAPKGAYENIVPRSHFEPEPIPKWCPLRKKDYSEERFVNGELTYKLTTKLRE